MKQNELIISVIIISVIIGLNIGFVLYFHSIGTSKNQGRISQTEAFNIINASTNIMTPPGSNINQTIIQKGYNVKYNLYEFKVMLHIPNIKLVINRTVFVTPDGKYVLPAIPYFNRSVRR